MEREIYRAVPKRIRSQELWVLYETEAMENSPLDPPSHTITIINLLVTPFRVIILAQILTAVACSFIFIFRVD